LVRVVVTQYTVANLAQADRTVSKIRGQSQKEADATIASRVSEIISEIRKSGDRGLVSLTKKFDSPKISSPRDLRVTSAEIKRAYSKVSKESIRALKVESEQISYIANQQMTRFGERRSRSPLGFVIRESYVPFRRIGGYVPGGLASYPSTVSMIAATARAAGVEEIVITTPPRKDGSVDDSVLVAANINGIKEIIKAGGAQAIAALAFGTRSIKKVDLIAGPGNQYVTEAKRQVSAMRQVLIESLAGPTELLIIADGSADPVLVAEDLISQAEHGNNTLCGVVSNSAELIQSVAERLRSISGRPRLAQILESSLFTVLVRTMEMMVEFAQKFAPEHLEVMVANPSSLESKLTNSGLVLLGDYTPCSSTDYIAGSNHILPTGGTARVASGLSVENFLKRVTTVSASKESLRRSSRYISVLANMENLPNHGWVALIRYKK
jgi:histidinol dehydrogenase